MKFLSDLICSIYTLRLIALHAFIAEVVKQEVEESPQTEVLRTSAREMEISDTFPLHFHPHWRWLSWCLLSIFLDESVEVSYQCQGPPGSHSQADWPLAKQFPFRAHHHFQLRLNILKCCCIVSLVPYSAAPQH